MMSNYDNTFEDKKTKRVVYGLMWLASAGVCSYVFWWWATAS